MPVFIHHLFISPGHNFFGRHGQAADTQPEVSVAKVMCRAGRGLEGDRFFDFKADYKGQVTFFAWETYEAIKLALNVPQLAPGAFRRNVVVAGLDLNELIGRRFQLGGIGFEGTGEAKPCYWMNQAVAPGAETWLLGQGGLRARIISDGELTTGVTEFAVLAAEISPASAGSAAPA